MISRFLSLCLLLLLSPIFLIISIFIFIDDGRPVFFRQKRVGLNEEQFWIFKFRTMKKNTPDIPTHLLGKTDNMYTKIGPFLRKFSLDEIPQFLNIFLGDLVFIGPRPALYNQKNLIKLRRNRGIQKLKPGITGWAQVNGRDEIDIKKKVALDYVYLKNKNIILDIKILCLTFFKVFKAENVSN